MTETSGKTIESTGKLEAKLLSLAAGLGLSDGAVEREAGLPQAFLAKARKGERSGPKAAPSWARLRALLVTKLGPERVDDELGTVAPATPAPAAPSKATAPETKDKAEEIAERIASVRSQEDRREVEQLLAAEIVRGTVDPRRGELALDALKELGRALRDEAEEKGRAQLAALEILSPAEQAWLIERRAKEAATPLRPGESAATAPAPLPEAPSPTPEGEPGGER